MSDTEVLPDIGNLDRMDFEFFAEAELEQDTKLAEVMFETMCAVTSQFIMSGVTWMHRFPGRFVALLDKKPELVWKHLAATRQSFNLLMELQRLSHDEPWARAFWGDLQWPGQSFVMETMFMLRELELNSLSPEVIVLLQGVGNAWHSTLVNEDGFNRLRSVSDGPSAGQMQRVARWGCLAASCLLEKHGRPNVTVTPSLRATSRTAPPADTFTARDANEFDLGADTLETMRSTSWAHPSPAVNKLAGCAWACWGFCEGRIEEASRSWLSLLASLA